MSTESFIVEKMGNNLIRRQGQDTIIPISPQEYDSLRPIRAEAVERRDELVKSGLDIVAATTGGVSALSINELGQLAQTNRVVLQGLLGDNGSLGNIDFITSGYAANQFVDSIINNDVRTFQLFMRTREFTFGGRDNHNNDIYGHAIEMCIELNRSTMLRSILRRWNLLKRLGIVFMRRCAQLVCVARNYNILRLFARYTTPFGGVDLFKSHMFTAACRVYWKDAIKFLGMMKETLIEFGLTSAADVRHFNMYYLINGGDLGLIREILDHREPESLDYIFLENLRDTPVIEALRVQRYDIVEYFLSKSRPGFSVCGNDAKIPLTLLTAIKYVDPIDNVIYAPLEIIRRIIVDIRNFERASGGGGDISRLLSEEGVGEGRGERLPLIACCERDDALELGRILLDNGARADGPVLDQNRNSTPLIEASRRGNLPLVRLLLERGATPIRTSKYYSDYSKSYVPYKIVETPLFVAARLNHREIFDLLLSLHDSEKRVNGPLVKIKYEGNNTTVDFLTAITLCDVLQDVESNIKDETILGHLIDTHNFGINFIRWEHIYESNPDQESFFDVLLNYISGLDSAYYDLNLIKRYFTTVYLKLNRDQKDVIMPTLLQNRKYIEFYSEEYDFLLSLPQARIEDIDLRQSILDGSVSQIKYFLGKGINSNKIIEYREEGQPIFRGTALQFALHLRTKESAKITEAPTPYEREMHFNYLERMSRIIQILQPRAAGGGAQ